jgi:hypothetical protein
VTHRLSLAGSLAVIAACRAGAPYPSPIPDPTDQPTPPAPPPLVVSPIQLRPADLRYTIHRRLRVEQELAGQPPTQMSYRVFVTAKITGPPDSAGYAVVHAVDSVVPDSGTFVPPTVNFAAVRGLRFNGRLTAIGAVRDAIPSDSVTAKTFSQFIGNIRDFYPRLPPTGLVPDAAWTDTVTTTDPAEGGEVQVYRIHQAIVTGWEPRAGVQCLRIQVHGTFTLQGAGEQGGQSYELMGNGTRSALEYVSQDGRYLGGETHDSLSLSVSLPAQGMTVPIRQVLHSSVTVLP